MGDVAEPAAAGVRPIWCIVAKVVAERPYGPGGRQRRLGTALFPGGATVYVPDGHEGMGYQTVTVIGHTRHRGRLATVDMAIGFLTTWHVELVYSPAVLARIAEVLDKPARGFSRHGADRAGVDHSLDAGRGRATTPGTTHGSARVLLIRVGAGRRSCPEGARLPNRDLAVPPTVDSRDAPAAPFLVRPGRPVLVNERLDPPQTASRPSRLCRYPRTDASGWGSFVNADTASASSVILARTYPAVAPTSPPVFSACPA